jgi:hypothetical protein
VRNKEDRESLKVYTRRKKKNKENFKKSKYCNENDKYWNSINKFMEVRIILNYIECVYSFHWYQSVAFYFRDRVRDNIEEEIIEVANT